jgi:hypothetical protein
MAGEQPFMLRQEEAGSGAVRALLKGGLSELLLSLSTNLATCCALEDGAALDVVC